VYRLFGMGAGLLWVSAMTALFVRDVWPAWTAQDAPPMSKEILSDLRGRQEQFGIFRADGSRVATAWTSVEGSGTNTFISSTVHLEDLGFPVPSVLIETRIEFAEDGELNSFDLDVYGVPMITIKVHGEQRGIYFPCELQIGALRREANLELSASRLIGDTLRPFNYLPMLKVGQSWRMQLIDPLSAVISQRTRFTPIVARVTHTERIPHGGVELECFVVETTPGQAKAWVAPDGRVIRQEVDVPGIGQVTAREERYEGKHREKVRLRYRRYGEGDGNDADDPN